MIDLAPTGPSNDDTNINHTLNNRESGSTKYIQENEDEPMCHSHKTYSQRNNRAKLNYRDLDRGMYEKIHQSGWTFGNQRLLNKHNINGKSHRHYSDDDEEIIDLSIDDDDDKILVEKEDKSNETNLLHHRRWCICKEPWDHSRLMLRCDSCANWYHGDCIGITKEQGRVLEMNCDSFVCPSCQGISKYSKMKPARSLNESILTKRKRSVDTSPTNNHQIRGNKILSKSISNDESTKRAKTDASLRHNSVSEFKTHCIVHGCLNLSKSGWVYCSSACIRLHINDTLQAIQRSNGVDSEDLPTREDILLYESKTRKILEKNLVPNIEDLCTWINQHPSYELVKPTTQQSILLPANQSTGLTRSLSSVVNTSKPKLSRTAIASNQEKNTKSIPKKHSPIQITRQISNTTSTADIRSKVPTALYDKIIMRLEKNGENYLLKENIRTIVEKIEEEMYHVYGKVDNSYKNKFRSLLANISNMNNNYFYKQILSKELTAKQIVAMKSEDMLPPEEKEKRKDEFDKEIEMIIKAGTQTAEEMARRTTIKVSRQGLVDNDTLLPVLKSKEQISPTNKTENIKINESISVSKKMIKIKPTTNKSVSSTTDEKSTAKPKLNIQTSSSTPPEHFPNTSVTNKITSNEPLKSSIHEESNPNFSAADLDNDYIEPESPTGIDALLYDDDGDDDDDDDINTPSRSSTDQQQSPIDHTELPYQNIIRDDYNPSRTKTETTSIYQSTPNVRLPNKNNQWHGIIHPSDAKIPCQSIHVYGESDYLIGDIPEQLIILGRLRLADLWDFIRDSLSVRDILILTLISSSSANNNDKEIFSQYVDIMRSSKRAAVISKRTDSSFIRDMYILAADTIDCPSNVLSTLSLPITIDSKQLFLVIIGSGKRTTKSINRFHDNQSLNNLTYKPGVLQDTTVIRDPRLLRNKDPRLSGSGTIGDLTGVSTVQSIITNTNKQISAQYSNEDLLKLVSDSLEQIRHCPTVDGVRPIVMSTMEILKANRRDDLSGRFTNDLRTAMAEWQARRETSSSTTTTIVPGDNLIEENMDVDDEQDDKQKKAIVTSSTSSFTSEYNDTDYRFLHQDMVHPITKTTQDSPNSKERMRKSRFSDILSIDRTIKFKSNIHIDKIFSKEEEPETEVIDTDNAKILSSKPADKNINSSLSNKFRPLINLTESFVFETNTKNRFTSKPIRFSFAKDPLRRRKPNISFPTATTTNNNDMYESSPKFIEDLIKKVQLYGYQGLSFSNNNWTKQTLPITPLRSKAMLNLITQQQKTKNRFSFNVKEWKSNNNNYMTHYHDFDRPQE